MLSTTASLVLALALGACGPGGSSATDDGMIPIPPIELPFEIPVTNLVVDPGPEIGSVVLRFPAPGEPGEGSASSYVVRASRRHIDTANHLTAPILPVTYTPQSPGSQEAVVVRGLEPGRTLQFSVQAVRGGETGPFGYGAGGRVAGDDLPSPPGGAIPLTGPATLSVNGATYLLMNDVTTSGTAFTVTARDVTLDLGGHTVTYGTGGGTSYGVYAQDTTANSAVIVRGGRIVQGGSGTACHGVFLYRVGEVRVSYVDVTVSGPDTSGIWVADSPRDVRVDHCRVDCRTQVVVNRHYPGVSAIIIEQASGPVEVDENLVVASPQWGIRVEGKSSTGESLIHHNRVIGTKALVANGYMLAAHKPGTEIYENDARGESRGIHVDAVDADGTNAYIHDNRVESQDQPNAESPGRNWTHGIKMENADGCRIERNYVITRADAAHGDALALDIAIGPARGIVVQQNRFEAISVTPDLQGRAVNWTFGAEFTPTDTLLRNNLFVATDTFVHRAWDGGAGGLSLRNWWVRDTSQGAAHPFAFEFFENGDQISSPGHRFADPYTTEDPLDVAQWASPETYDSTREWSLTVWARAGSAPLAGATVAVRDRTNATVWQRTTDAAGRVSDLVVGTLVTRGPTYDARSPYRITVSAPGHTTWEGTYTIDQRTALIVDLTAGVATPDASPPAAPAGVTPYVLSASRALVTWDVPADDTEVSAYLVYLNGTPAGITEVPGLFLGGLDAAQAYTFTVRAVDAAGRLGPPSAGAGFATRPEDRGL